MKKTIKKSLAVFMALLMLACTVPMTIGASDEKLTEGYYAYTVENGKASIIDCDESINVDVIIPDTLGGYPVTNIGDSAFEYCTDLTSITIPDGVTSIGDDAFENCTGLTSVTIGNSVTSIGIGALYRCTSLTSITIPNSVTSIGADAFSSCTGLTSITVSSGNKVYHSENNCIINTGVKELVLGCKNSVIPSDGSVTSIGYSAFRGCTGLASITIPDGVTSIDSYAFYRCTGLTSVTIGNSVTSINSSTFEGCTGLTSITVSPGNKVYHSENNCIINTKRKELILGCKNSVIPSDGSVTSIGSSAFRYCTGLTSVTIPDSVTSIGYSAFNDCTGLTSITIPDSVTSIDEYAFSGCTGLTSITIPDSVTSIGYEAFSGCTGLTSITVSPGNKVYHSENNCIIDTEEKELVVGFKNSVIPSDGSVTSIGYRAFDDCTGLTSITIPNSITSIGSSAFRYCTGLTSITIPNSVTSIGDLAFYGCTGLTSITIPDSVTSIGRSAFCGCTGLTSITIPNSVTSIGEYALGYYYDEENDVTAKVSDFVIHGFTGTVAESYANENGFTFTPLEDDENEAKNESTGISIIYPDNAYSNDIQLNVSVVTSGSAFNVLNTEKASFKKSLFDISTTINGEKVQPNGSVFVKIPLPEEYNAEKTYVYYVTNDGKLERIPSRIENGYIIFETTHFSFYAIVDETEKEEPVNPPKPENPSNNCSCICHKGGISKFFYKIARFFWKLFKTHKECSCGVMHY